MLWWELLIPAAVTAVVIRAGAVFVGPYWTFAEVVPGMGSIEAKEKFRDRTLRAAIVRRYVYVTLLGASLVAMDSARTIWHGVLGGIVVAALLLWPILFHGLPWGVAPSDWQLIPLYIGVIASFASAGAFGYLLVAYIRASSEGDVVRWLLDKAIETGFVAVLGLSGFAFFRGAFESLSQKRRMREEQALAGHDGTDP